MKKKHIIWLLLIVCVAGAAFYVYSARHDVALAQQATDKTTTTAANTTQETDSATEKGPADMDAVAEDTAAEEAVAVKETAAPAAQRDTGPRVDVVAALAQELGVEVQAVGSLWARDAVMLRAELTGKVAGEDFKERSAVQQGQQLLKIDDSLLIDERNQAQAHQE